MGKTSHNEKDFDEKINDLGESKSIDLKRIKEARNPIH